MASVMEMGWEKRYCVEVCDSNTIAVVSDVMANFDELEQALTLKHNTLNSKPELDIRIWDWEELDWVA